MYREDVIYELVKSRLDRGGMDIPDAQHSYWMGCIRAAAASLESNGIVLTDSAADSSLIADMAVWNIQSRDKPGGMPDWLRLRRRERWIQQREVSTDDSE